MMCSCSVCKWAPFPPGPAKPSCASLDTASYSSALMREKQCSPRRRNGSSANYFIVESCLLVIISDMIYLHFKWDKSSSVALLERSQGQQKNNMNIFKNIFLKQQHTYTHTQKKHTRTNQKTKPKQKKTPKKPPKTKQAPTHTHTTHPVLYDTTAWISPAKFPVLF